LDARLPFWEVQQRGSRDEIELQQSESANHRLEWTAEK
jgi:hypothetical protein